ncbi:hypothetical protein B0O80DRAFT_454508, partial [Mortierella sp. GBAus27b]
MISSVLSIPATMCSNIGHDSRTSCTCLETKVSDPGSCATAVRVKSILVNVAMWPRSRYKLNVCSSKEQALTSSRLRGRGADCSRRACSWSVTYLSTLLISIQSRHGHVRAAKHSQNRSIKGRE